MKEDNTVNYEDVWCLVCRSSRVVSLRGRPEDIDHLVPVAFAVKKISCRSTLVFSLENISGSTYSRHYGLPISSPTIMHGSSRPNSPALSPGSLPCSTPFSA